jgi:preprotein translocase subunit SecD
VLYVFGNQFGASIVKGYALTLGLGVILSMFTAFFLTRTFMRALLSSRVQHDKRAQTLVGY